MMTNEDRYFLLHFILGTYFGPDIKGEETQKSALQRKAEDLPPYTQEQLAGSHIRTAEIKQLYYFLVRKTERSLVVKLPILHQFIQGNHPSEVPQFPSLFPPHLHPQTESLNGSQIIADVVIIRNPVISYIEQEVIEKFKRLTGLEYLSIENKRSSPLQGKQVDDVDNDDVPILQYYRGTPRKKLLTEILRAEKAHGRAEESNGKPKLHELALSPSGNQLKSSEARDGPTVVVLPSQPRREDLDHIVEIAGNAYALTGSAAKGQVGPVIGLMDIGESDDSYYFRVALPGVKRENRAFQCKVESDGRVLIRGETVTGEKRVERFSQAFVMQTQNLCPSGPFSVLFRLPGPVDPKRFSGTFGTDGILEGIVMKQTPPTMT